MAIVLTSSVRLEESTKKHLHLFEEVEKAHLLSFLAKQDQDEVGGLQKHYW